MVLQKSSVTFQKKKKNERLVASKERLVHEAGHVSWVKNTP